MKSLDKINSKLKFEKFFKLSDKEWENPFVYLYGILDNVKNDVDFLNTFKDKIRFDLLFSHNDVYLKVIEQFIDCYDERTWNVIFNSQRINIAFVNKYYKHIKFQINPTSYIFNQIPKLNTEVKVYLIENGYLKDLVANYSNCVSIVL